MSHEEGSLQEIQAQVSRWAEDTRRLFSTLPQVFTRLEEMDAETRRLRQRVEALQQERVDIERSRDRLAQLFARLQELIATHAADGAPGARDLEATASIAEPESPGSDTRVRLASVFRQAVRKS